MEGVKKEIAAVSYLMWLDKVCKESEEDGDNKYVRIDECGQGVK